MNPYGFYHTHGDLNNLIPPMLSANQRLLAVTWEFGTLGSGYLSKLKTLNRLIVENQGFHYGYKNEKLKKAVDHKFTQLFNPTEQKWQENVLQRSKKLFKLNLKRYGIL